VDRIRKLVPYFEQGRFLLPPGRSYTGHDGKTYDLIHVLVEHELLRFPVSEHDDMLDAIARVLDEDLKAKPAEGTMSRNGGHVPRVIQSPGFMAQHPNYRGITGTHRPRHLIAGADGGSRSIFAVDPLPESTGAKAREPDYIRNCATGTLDKGEAMKRIIEARLPSGEPLAIEFDHDPTPAEIRQRVDAYVSGKRAKPAPRPAAPRGVPPGYTQPEWADMPEERRDFFLRRPRQPRVVRSKGWGATVGRRAR
jgi:hypothetical protein